MWSKYITRRLAVQVAQAWNFGWGEAMKKVYGISVNNSLVFRDSNKTEYYVDQKQHQKYIKGLYRLLDKYSFVKSFHTEVKKKLESILKEVKKQLRKDFSELSNFELLRLYKRVILPNTEQFYIRMWTVFNIADPLTKVILSSLEQKIKNKNTINNYLLSLSFQLEPNDVLKARIDILKLASIKNKLSQQEFLKRVSRHTKKYQHIPMFDFDHNPYGEDYFLNELKNIKNPSIELKKLEQSFVNNKKIYKKIVNEIKPDKKLKNLLKFLKENIFLRDHRDMIRQKLNLELRTFYMEVGERLGLNIKQVAILTNIEIINHLKNNKKFSKQEIVKRSKTFLLIQKQDKVIIFSGDKAVDQFRKEVRYKKNSRITEIKGAAASPGFVRGKVKIVYTNKDLNKIKKGDILVATMTRQDFVPAMRKAKAIITDEGGIICHAAIIARELDTPCIVGAKIATQVLHDGDIVEVDANLGKIKIC